MNDLLGHHSKALYILRFYLLEFKRKRAWSVSTRLKIGRTTEGTLGR
jgi:hypothetical protein